MIIGFNKVILNIGKRGLKQKGLSLKEINKIMMLELSLKKIFSLVVALLTLVSCSEDFLNLTPQYYPNDATFFKTQEQFTQAVNGAYSALRGVSARQGYLMGEMRSDNTHYTRYKADRGLHILYRENIADFVVDDQNQWTNEMYYACYTGISRANTILNRIEGTTFPDDFKNKTIVMTWNTPFFIMIFSH